MKKQKFKLDIDWKRAKVENGEIVFSGDILGYFCELIVPFGKGREAQDIAKEVLEKDFGYGKSS